MSNGAGTAILIIISSIYFWLSRLILSIAYQIKYITWQNALCNTHVGYRFFVSSTCKLIFLIEIVNLQSHSFNTIRHFYMHQGLKISLKTNLSVVGLYRFMELNKFESDTNTIYLFVVFLCFKVSKGY